MDPSNEIHIDLSPYCLIYKDGSIERLMGKETVPPSVDPDSGVSSKDVEIRPELGVSARIYIPKVEDKHTQKRIPVFVYYHGGGFCIASAASPTYHRYLNSLVAVANVVAVSVSYRLAPEHPLPAAYDDSWEALRWVASHASGGAEEWLAEHGDFDRLIVAGDSAGGNIAHNMAMRAGREELGHAVKIHSIVLFHPYFSGSDSIGKEEAGKKMAHDLWKFVCPSSIGPDDPLINPVASGAPSLSALGCARVLVCVAEKDRVRDRGWLYYHALRSSGWKGTVEILESEGENHVFFLFDTGEKARIFTRRVVDWMLA